VSDSKLRHPLVEAIPRVFLNVVWGIKWGVILGAIPCGLSLIGAVVRATHSFEASGSTSSVTLRTALLVDVVGSLAAGTIMGLVRPLLRWRAGAIVTGIVDGIVWFVLAGTAVRGSPWNWGTPYWVGVMAAGMSIGGLVANGFWEDFIEPKLKGPKLPPGPAPPSPPLGLWRPR